LSYGPAASSYHPLLIDSGSSGASWSREGWRSWRSALASICPDALAGDRDVPADLLQLCSQPSGEPSAGRSSPFASRGVSEFSTLLVLPPAGRCRSCSRPASRPVLVLDEVAQGVLFLADRVRGRWAPGRSWRTLRTFATGTSSLDRDLFRGGSLPTLEQAVWKFGYSLFMVLDHVHRDPDGGWPGLDGPGESPCRSTSGVGLNLYTQRYSKLVDRPSADVALLDEIQELKASVRIFFAIEMTDLRLASTSPSGPARLGLPLLDDLQDGP